MNSINIKFLTNVRHLREIIKKEEEKDRINNENDIFT